jgi:hypothetical protein
MAAKNTYEPSLTGIPKRSLDFILHYLFLQRMQQSKNPSLPSTFNGVRHPHYLFQYYKNFRIVNRLKGSALSLLQTQYAKKPKNPV